MEASADVITVSQTLVGAGALVAVMFGLLMALLGWLGNRLYNRVDEIGRSVHNIEADIHGKISVLDRRVTGLEIRVDLAEKGRV